MYGWQDPYNGYRIYRVKDNSPMTGFFDVIAQGDSAVDFSSAREKERNLGIHVFEGQLYSSNYVGICRMRDLNNNVVKDSDGNEIVINVVPRFGTDISELLNYISTDDEFDRYLAPQTISNRHFDKEIDSLEENELFHFYIDEDPIKADVSLQNESSILTATVYISLLKSLCRRPLMGKMLKKEENLTGKVKGKINIGENIKNNSFCGRNDRFFCSYLTYTTNILENQILKAALIKAKRFISIYYGSLIRTNNESIQDISYCMNALKNVDEIQCSANDCSKLSFTGFYSYYKPVVNAARMILEEISFQASGELNQSGYVMPYAISMEKIFEVYIRAYLKKHGIKSYRDSSTSGIRLEKYDEKIDVFSEEENLENPGKYISGPIKPDIILTNLSTDKKAVYDVKYKDYMKGSRDDRLQLLAYSMMLNADNIGIILPAKENENDVTFDSRKINSFENRLVKYHQMLLNIDDQNNDEIADYIKKNSFNNSDSEE